MCALVIGFYGQDLVVNYLRYNNQLYLSDDKPYSNLAVKIATLIDRTKPFDEDPGFMILHRPYVVFTRYKDIDAYFEFAGAHETDDQIYSHDGILYGQPPHALSDFSYDPNTIIIVTKQKIGESSYKETRPGVLGLIPNSKKLYRSRYKLYAIETSTGRLAFRNEVLEDAPFTSGYALKNSTERSGRGDLAKGKNTLERYSEMG